MLAWPLLASPPPDGLVLRTAAQATSCLPALDVRSRCIRKKKLEKVGLEPQRGNNCGTFEAYEYWVCDRSAGIKTEGTARRLEGWYATQAVPSSNLLNRLNLSPFIPEFLSSIFNIFSFLPPAQGLSGYHLREPTQNSGEPIFFSLSPTENSEKPTLARYRYSICKECLFLPDCHPNPLYCPLGQYHVTTLSRAN